VFAVPKAGNVWETVQEIIPPAAFVKDREELWPEMVAQGKNPGPVVCAFP